MSADTLRLRAQRHDRKARRAVLISAAIAILLFVWFGWAFFRFPKIQIFGLGALGLWSVRLGFGVLSLWGLYSGYKTYKVLWPRFLASDADLKTTVQSYTDQLEKRRDYSRNIWLRSGLIFCFLGLAMVVVPIFVRDIASPLQLLENVGPILGLLVLWLAIFIPLRKRKLGKLDREIAQMRALQS